MLNIIYWKLIVSKGQISSVRPFETRRTLLPGPRGPNCGFTCAAGAAAHFETPLDAHRRKQAPQFIVIMVCVS